MTELPCPTSFWGFKLPPLSFPLKCMKKAGVCVCCIGKEKIMAHIKCLCYKTRFSHVHIHLLFTTTLRDEPYAQIMDEETESENG